MDRGVLAPVPAVSALGRTGPRSGFCGAGLFTRPPRYALLAAALQLATLRLSPAVWWRAMAVLRGHGEPAPAACAWPQHGGDPAHLVMDALEETRNVLWEAWMGPRWERRPNAAPGQDPALAGNRLGGLWRDVRGQAKPLLQGTGFSSPGIPASPGFTF